MCAGDQVHRLSYPQQPAIDALASAQRDATLTRAMVRDHLDRLAARHVPAEGQTLLHAADHGAAADDGYATAAPYR